jgi:hypothetical protein
MSTYIPNTLTASSILIDGVGSSYQVRYTEDSHGRLRITRPDGGFYANFNDSVHDELMEFYTSGTGVTETFNNGYLRLAIPATVSTKAVKQSRYLKYQTGSTYLSCFDCTLVNSSSNVNIICRVGRFDDSADKTTNDTGTGDGHYFEYINGTINIVERSSVSGSIVNTAVAQSSWNIDKLDSTGTSGYTLVPSNMNTYVIETSLPGAVKFGVIFNYGIVWCHVIQQRAATVPPTRRTALPLRYELQQNGGAVACTNNIASIYSYNLIGEPSNTFLKTNYMSENTYAVSTVGVTYTNIFAVRLKAGFNRSSAVLAKVYASLQNTARAFYIRVYVGIPGNTLTATGSTNTWTSLETNSSLEYLTFGTGNNTSATGGNGTITSTGVGSFIYSGCGYGTNGIDDYLIDFSNINNIPNNYYINSLVNGTQNVLLVQARTTTATAGDFSFTFIEYI